MSDQLVMELKEARKNVDESLDRFTEAVLKVADAGQTQVASEEASKLAAQQEKQVKRLINHLAIRDYAGDYHTTWIVAYGKLAENTGYHPAAVNPDSRKPHIEFCRRDNHIGDLLKAVQELIRDVSWTAVR